MISRRRILLGRQGFCVAKCFTIGLLIIIFNLSLFQLRKEDQYIKVEPIDHHFATLLQTLKPSDHHFATLLQTLKPSDINFNYTYENFTQWNRSLCSIRSDQRGPHQKVIALSIYGSPSKFTDNPMYSWNTSIIPFLEPLANEVKSLLPTWVIRAYIDFTGSTQSQRDLIHSFSNIDVCDMTNIPFFGPSLPTYLSGRMWRFIAVFDPYIDYLLSRDLDSPITKRETETIDMWLSSEQEKNYFYIARDNRQHDIYILAGLWGAATVRARRYLFDIFQPILVPSIARRYNGLGDQPFLSDFIWEKVKTNSLAFDSYSCQKFGGRPFLSERPIDNCFLGCIRPCCTNRIENNTVIYNMTCPIACRPKDHQDWTRC